MKKTLLAVLLTILIISLSACKEDPIDCVNDPSCDIIDDDAFQQLMEDRGIEDATMTTLELEDVYETLNLFFLHPDDYIDISLRGVFDLYLDAVYSNYPHQESTIIDLRIRLQHMYETDPIINDMLNLEKLNTNNKQYFIFENVSYLVYKIGDNLYQYEVARNNLYEFTIDTSANTITYETQEITVEKDIAHEFIQEKHLFDDIYFDVVDEVIYYHFEHPLYGGYVVGVYNMDTLSRYEIIFNEDSFDIIEYMSLLSVKTRFTNEEFEGTVSEFFVYITDPFTPFPGQFEPFMTTIAYLYQNQTVKYHLDYTDD